jgi:hypothetical protein
MRVDEAGQELELHVAEVALGAQLLFDLVLEQADGFGEREVGPQLPGIERLDAVGTSVGAGVGAGVGHGVTRSVRIQSM